MATASDAEKIAAYAESHLCLAQARLSDAYYYQSLPMCVIDAVFSVGVRYGQVQKVISTFSKVTGWHVFRPHGSSFPAEKCQQTTSDLVDTVNQHPEPAKSLFHNKGYANPRSRLGRVRKADLVQALALLLKNEAIETFQDLEGRKKHLGLEDKIRSLPALGSGIVVRYFLMLAGDDIQVKPDRMILRFIKDATGKQVAVDEAANRIQQASTILRKKYSSMTPRLLDHEIWKHQRQKRASSLPSIEI